MTDQQLNHFIAGVLGCAIGIGIGFVATPLLSDHDKWRDRYDTALQAELYERFDDRRVDQAYQAVADDLAEWQEACSQIRC